LAGAIGVSGGNGNQDQTVATAVPRCSRTEHCLQSERI
jgi:uncharacterized protein GlcG (DUF336 family)